MKKALIAAAIIMTAMMTYAQSTVFLDTFNTADSADINAGVTSRQAGGFVESTYAVNAASTIVGNQMKRAGGGILALNTNLTTYISSGTFTVSCNLTVNGTDAKWSSLYLRSGSEVNRSQSPFGFHAWDGGNGVAFSVYQGVGAQTIVNVTTATLTTLLGSTYDKTATHAIELISTAGAGGTNTYDFVVDGVVVLNDLIYKFGEDTQRSLEFVATTLATSSVYFDNLTVLGSISLPGTFRLIGISEPL